MRDFREKGPGIRDRDPLFQTLVLREWIIRITERTRKKTNGESGSLRSPLFLFCFVFFLNSSQYYSAALANKRNRLWIPEKFDIVTRQWLSIQQQQQQHKLYLHDYNYLVTVLQKLKHKVTIYNNNNAMQWLLESIKCHQYDLITNKYVNHYIMRQISTNMNLRKNSVNSSI